MSEPRKVYDFRPRPRHPALGYGRGRGLYGLGRGVDNLVSEHNTMNLHLVSELVDHDVQQKLPGNEQFEDVHENEGMSDNTCSEKVVTVDVHQSDDQSTCDNYAELPTSSRFNENNDRYDNITRELALAKQELTESRVRNATQREEIHQQYVAYDELYEEIAQLKQNFQHRLEQTENELHVTKQKLANSTIHDVKRQVRGNPASQCEPVYTPVFEYCHGNTNQSHLKYDDRSRENMYEPSYPRNAHYPGSQSVYSRSTINSNADFEEPRFRMPYFNGKNKFEGFWSVFELGVRKFQWDENTQVEKLWCSLKDDALDFASTLSFEVQNDIFKFKDALKRRYGVNKLPEQYREDLSCVRKYHKETLVEYASRVENLVCKGYPYLKQDVMLDTLKVESFLKGLPDQSLAYEVKIRKPRNIDEAIELFNWHECCKGNIFKKRTEVRQVTVDGDAYYHESDNVDIRKVNGNAPRYVTEERLEKRLKVLSSELRTEFREIEGN